MVALGPLGFGPTYKNKKYLLTNGSTGNIKRSFALQFVRLIDMTRWRSTRELGGLEDRKPAPEFSANSPQASGKRISQGVRKWHTSSAESWASLACG